MTVAVLFARQDSYYKTLPNVDVYDIDRDARTWPGGCPVVAHPPCRAWGNLSHLAKPRHDEKSLAIFAVNQLRKYGGVLEHPAKSKLWAHQGLPKPGHTDNFGGITFPIYQGWFGHPCDKSTWLYVVGARPIDFPEMPIRLGRAPMVIACSKRRRVGGMAAWKMHPDYRPDCPIDQREHTPPALAEWLVDLASRCKVPA